MSKNKKAKAKIRKNKNSKVYGAENIMLIIICVILAVLVAVSYFSVDSSDYVDLTYEEAETKKYTYVSAEERERRRHDVFLTVKEEKAPIIISSISMNKADGEALSLLKSGDIIECFVVSTSYRGASYKAVEVRSGGKVILTLEGYNAAHRENANFGKMILPILFICAVAAIPFCFYAYKKDIRISNRRY